jgi:iron complex transport system substrate-binding protein
MRFSEVWRVFDFMTDVAAMQTQAATTGLSRNVEAYPRRIICLTEETTETLYLLGEGDRIVGISGYTVRPPEARRKPKVSAFINAKFEKIMALEPDLVLAFSDLQADIARELVRRGVTVFTFNQRSVTEILQMILTVGRLVGCAEKAARLATRLQSGLEEIRESARRFPRRPRVFFEEWNDPLISGIRWVEELIEIAGGEPLYPELRPQKVAKDRILDPSEVAARDPEVIIASWCGRAVKKSLIRQRPGWSDVTAVRHGHVYEIKSTYILQPGPASLTEGVRQLHYLIALSVGADVESHLAPAEAFDRDASAGNLRTG